LRPIRSFVRREGRITSAQQQALRELLPRYRLDREQLEQLLASGQRLALEIGFGNGEALLAMARQSPQRVFIGAEVYRPGLGRLLLQIQQHQLENIRVFDADVNLLLNTLLPVNCLEEVCIFFPDPWPKKRHHKRRLIGPDFVRQLASRTCPEGHLYIATDWPGYAESILAVMHESTDWVNLSASGDYVARASFRPLTRFEQRGTKLGHPVFDFCFAYRPIQPGDEPGGHGSDER